MEFVGFSEGACTCSNGLVLGYRSGAKTDSGAAAKVELSRTNDDGRAEDQCAVLMLRRSIVR